MNKGESTTATIVPETGSDPVLAFGTAPNHVEEVDSKLDAAREQLLALRRQQEELERQKSELEELRRRQDEYSRGKAEMIEKLTRGLATLERDQLEAQRRATLCDQTIAAFQEYLEQLHQLHDEDWTSQNLRAELARALGVIENARLEYNRARTRLDCLNPAAGQPAIVPEPPAARPLRWEEIVRYASIGAAATAPLILAGTIWLIVFVAVR